MAALQSGRFRHVAFPNDGSRRRKLHDFSKANPVRPMPPEREFIGTLSAEDAAFLDWLFIQVGLEARNYRAEAITRRLPACLRSLRVRSVEQARTLLEQKPSLVATAISAMLIGVSSFFRDAQVFSALNTEIIPGLIRARKGVHVWSAGCADGGELYSIAMLLAEKEVLHGSYLLGTDCRADAIARARAAYFEASSENAVPPALRSRYLVREGDLRRVAPLLRRATRWRTADLLHVQEPGVWDLILCRNTTMYMRSDVTHALWPKLEGLLRPGGVLVLGKAERPVGVRRLTPAGPCMYRRTRG